MIDTSAENILSEGSESWGVAESGEPMITSPEEDITLMTSRQGCGFFTKNDLLKVDSWDCRQVVKMNAGVLPNDNEEQQKVAKPIIKKL